MKRGRPTGLRAAADRQLLPTYFTGRPCIRGHIAERRTDSGQCVECHRENSRLRYRALRQSRSAHTSA